MPESRFRYTTFSDKAVAIDKSITDAANDMEGQINEGLPDGREKVLAITKLEECMMWVRKALRDVGPFATALLVFVLPALAYAQESVVAVAAGLSPTAKAMTVATVVAGAVTEILNRIGVFGKIPSQLKVLLPFCLGAVVAFVSSFTAGLAWEDALIVGLTAGAAAVGWHQGATRARAAAPLLLVGVMSMNMMGCASLPQVKPYRYDDQHASGEELCSELGAAASYRSSLEFGFGVATSAIGGAAIAGLSAVPDGNLKIGDVDGPVTRAVSQAVSAVITALGVYLIMSSTDADELAAAAANALIFDEEETVGEERDMGAFSRCVDALAQFSNAGSARRSQWVSEATQ